jgi:hypothetical protein
VTNKDDSDGSSRGQAAEQKKQSGDRSEERCAETLQGWIDPRLGMPDGWESFRHLLVTAILRKPGEIEDWDLDTDDESFKGDIDSLRAAIEGLPNSIRSGDLE